MTELAVEQIHPAICRAVRHHIRCRYNHGVGLAASVFPKKENIVIESTLVSLEYQRIKIGATISSAFGRQS